ncbi:RfaG Glycosyltransferase [Candidatus Nanopelagicaceae bacterium]
MRNIIFLQSKLPDDPRALRQLSDRWNSYGELLRKLNGRGEIWVVTPRPVNATAREILFSKFVRQVSSVELNKSILYRINALRRKIKAERIRVTLVIGDNQQTLLLALALKFSLRSLVRIQIQFHGDTYSFGNNRGFQGFLRVCLSRVGMINADSIRIVSRFQADEIRKISKNTKNKLVLAPIPIDFSRVATSSKNRLIDVAFIGRLHSERGINELIEIIKLLKSQRPSTTTLIVGDGPLKKLLGRELSSWLVDSTISMPGFLSSDELRDVYASARVLVSTAPNEGYGLTLREAAFSNVYVVARESKGSLETKESLPLRIETYSNTSEAVRLIRRRLSNEFVSEPTEEIAAQQKADAEGLNRLINSWVML